MALVFPAGNAGIECSTQENAIWGIASTPKSISAAAMDARLRPQPYTSRGPGQCSQLHPTISVPTYGILPWGSGYRDFAHQGAGTSSAAALAAGAVALIYSALPEVGTEQIPEALARSAAPVFRENEPQIGAGLLQIQRALEDLMTRVPP